MLCLASLVEPLLLIMVLNFFSSLQDGIKDC